MSTGQDQIHFDLFVEKSSAQETEFDFHEYSARTKKKRRNPSTPMLNETAKELELKRHLTPGVNVEKIESIAHDQ